jgi:hypothetical protein
MVKSITWTRGHFYPLNSGDISIRAWHPPDVHLDTGVSRRIYVSMGLLF